MKRFSRLFTISAAGFALAAASVLGIGSAAQAHDEPTMTTPADGSIQEAGVLQLSVMFSDSIMATDTNDGLAFEVIGPDGNAVLTAPDACLMAHDSMIMSQVEVVDAGVYTVNWRSVSSDGHPVSGSYSFEVTNENGYEATGANCLMAPMTVDMQMPGSTKDSSAAADDSGLWGLGTGVALLIAIATVATVLVNRKKKGRAEEAK